MKNDARLPSGSAYSHNQLSFGCRSGFSPRNDDRTNSLWHFALDRSKVSDYGDVYDLQLSRYFSSHFSALDQKGADGNKKLNNSAKNRVLTCMMLFGCQKGALQWTQRN